MPASETPMSQLGRSLQSGWVSCRRGLASNLGSLERGSDKARILNNFQMIRPGIWTSKGLGWTKHRDDAFNSGGTILDFSFFVDNAGTRTMLLQAGSKVQSYNLSTETATDVITGLTVTAYPTMRRFYSPVTGTSVVIYVNGDAEPKKITSVSASTTLTFNGGSWPGTFNSKSYSKPKFVEPFGSRAVYGGFAGATTAFDILISDHLDPETFTISSPGVATDGVAFTYPAELGALTSLRVVTLSNDSNSQVIIGGCTDGVFAIFGNDATDMGLRILTKDVGILSNRCFVLVGDDILYLSTFGVRAMSALTLNATGAQDALSFEIQDLINLIDDDNAYKAHAVHNPATQEVQFWVPLTGDGGIPKHAFILKYEAGQGPIWSTKDGTTVTASINFKGQVYGGDNSGFLQVHYSGDTYNGTVMTAQIALNVIGLGSPQQKTGMRKITIVTEGGTQKFTFAANRYSRMSNGNMTRSQAKPGAKVLSVGGGATTALGTWELGTGAFPSNHLKTIDYHPIGQGVWWDFEIATTASDHGLDFAGVAYTLKGGSLER